MRILVVGAGWLGLPLALSLEKSGHSVAVTKRIKEHGSALPAFIFDLNIESSWNCVKEFKPELLILCFPPGKDQSHLDQLGKFINDLDPNISIIYTSSIGLYLPQKTVDENSAVEEEHFVSKTERIIREKAENSIFLRLGGLIGANRHPVHYLAGRKDVADPEAPVNLVHRDDVIRAIEMVIRSGKFSGVYNIVNSAHPSRKEYYSKMARLLSLPAPEFSNEGSKGKKVVGDKFCGHFSFEYQTDINKI